MKKLKKNYAIKLEQAMNAQRNGDMKAYAFITAEAEDIKTQIDELQSANKS